MLSDYEMSGNYMFWYNISTCNWVAQDVSIFSIKELWMAICVAKRSIAGISLMVALYWLRQTINPRH